MNKSFVVKAGAYGFAAAAISFVVIAILAMTANFADPFDEILSGRIVPGADEFNNYISLLPALHIADNLLIFGWIAGWIGASILIGKRYRAFGKIILVLGLIGPLLDFLENEISWALVDIFARETGTPPDLYALWKIVRSVSYIVPYCAAILAGIGIWDKRPFDKIIACISSIGAVMAMPGIYIPGIWIISQAWWLIWFASLSIYIFRRAKNADIE